MKIRLFIFSCVLYFVILGAFVFHINSDPYTLEIASFSYTFSVAFWVVLPAFILFVFALLHMSFYGFLRYIKYKNFFKDSAKFEDFVCDVLLEKNPKPNFKTSEFKRAAELCLSMKKLEKIHNLNHFNEVIDLLMDINNDKIVNLKKFRLGFDNALFLRNEKNHILSDVSYSYDRIKHKKELEDELDNLAFKTVMQFGTVEQITNLKLPKNKEFIQQYIQRLKEENFTVELDKLENILTDTELSEGEYLSVAKSCVKKFDPNSLIAFFKKISDSNIEAKRAYCFVLAELALFDELKLEIKDDKKFNDFKLAILAREHNIKINLYDIIK